MQKRHYLDSGQLGIEDTLVVFLHDGSASIIGNVLATNTEPIFNIDTQWPKGDTLWMTPYVGKLNVDGSIDVSDTCRILGQSQPVILIPENGRDTLQTCVLYNFEYRLERRTCLGILNDRNLNPN